MAPPRPQPGRKVRKHKPRGYIKGICPWLGTTKETRRRANRKERHEAKRQVDLET